jgi:hypothetical protein
MGVEDHFVVLAIVEQAGGNAFHFGLDDLALAADERRLGARVGHDEAMASAFPYQHQQRDVLGPDDALAQHTLFSSLSSSAGSRRRCASVRSKPLTMAP